MPPALPDNEEEFDPYADIPDGVDISAAAKAEEVKEEVKEATKEFSKEAAKEELKEAIKEVGTRSSVNTPKVPDFDYDSPEDLIDTEAQDNFVESKEPSELLMCLVLASAYLGLAKYCWTPLFLANDKRLFYSIEGFFLSIALLAIFIGLRPFLTPSSLQVSHRGIKYRGPYWPQRKSVNWGQMSKIYLSPELIIVLYHPRADKKRLWPMIIPSIYLADRDRIAQVFLRYSPIKVVILSSPAPISRIIMVLLFLGAVIWLLEMLITQ